MTVKLKPQDQRTPTCFGIYHGGFFKFFAVVNQLQNIICIILITYEITITLKALLVVELKPLDERIRFCLRAIAWVWFVLHCLVSLLLDIRLLQTADLPSVPFLRLYSLIHWISLPLMFIWYFTLLLIGGNLLPYPPVIANVLFPGHVIYRVYTSYIVWRYSCDIDFELKMKSGYRNLTEEELELFEKGLDLAEERVKQKHLDSCYEMAQFQAYKRKEFEIERSCLDFSEAITLGCGEYGCVYKVAWNMGNQLVDVAVKTVDPAMSDINQFKALLTEAKVMMFMGKHENVVNLLGICTDEIRERKLFIVCELCELGNLRVHLRSERNTFVNLLNDKSTGDIKIDVESISAMSTIDLLKWASQIAAGMQFLAARKIIHGDLAARNILLTCQKQAKVTDFGLSRRLYNYSVYKKRNNVPLPWRWLALESLVDMSFSTYSDVWSYGVLLWELFELGARPWPEFQLFTGEFIETLKDGKVPEKGRYCNDEIYNLMCTCWKRNPAERPTFKYLNQYFCNSEQKVLNEGGFG